MTEKLSLNEGVTIMCKAIKADGGTVNKIVYDKDDALIEYTLKGRRLSMNVGRNRHD